MIIEGLKDLKSEIKLWKEEMREKFEDDPILAFRPGEIDVAYRFKGELTLNAELILIESLSQNKKIAING